MRITERDLELAATRLNNLTGNPIVKYENGKAQIGSYYISHAYGGVNLCQITNDGGGCRDVLRSGHMPKRELYGLIHAYIDGIEQGIEIAREQAA